MDPGMETESSAEHRTALAGSQRKSTPFGELSSELIAEFNAWRLHDHSKHRLLKLTAAILVWVVVSALPFLIPLGSPYGQLEDNVAARAFFVLVISFVVSFQFAYFAEANLILLGIRAPTHKVITAACTGGAALAASYVIFIGVGIFPVPWGIITVGIIPIGVFEVTNIALNIPADKRKDAEFKKKIKNAKMIVDTVALVYIILIFLFSAFVRVKDSPFLQTLFALSVPALKMTIRHVTKTNATKLAPDFVHGAGLMCEVAICAFSTILFTSIKEPTTFLLLVSTLAFCSQPFPALNYPRSYLCTGVRRRVRKSSLHEGDHLRRARRDDKNCSGC